MQVKVGGWSGWVAVLVATAVFGAACSPDEEDVASSRKGPSGGGGIGSPIAVSTPSAGLAPLTGGTLTILRDGVAAASIPDRSVVAFVDLNDGELAGVVALPPGSQPTRSTEDGAGNLQVILRGTGEVATISPRRFLVVSIEKVCAEPRGITWDASRGRTLVACATGELISRPLMGPRTVTRPGGELRDVLVRSTDVVVSTFRASTLSTVSDDGAASLLAVPPRIPFGVFESAPVAFVPGTAWKTLALRNGDFAMVHQRSVEGDLRATTALAGPEFVQETMTTFVPRPTGMTYYGVEIVVMDQVDNTIERPICTTGVVRSAVTVFGADGQVKGSQEVLGILPIDAAVSPDGSELAVVGAGNHQVTRVALSTVDTVEGKACGLVQAKTPAPMEDPLGQPVAVAYNGSLLVVQTRQPSRLLVMLGDHVIRSSDLPGVLLSTPGHTLFHTAPKAIACASCHPEGGDDGHVWTLPGEVRRTQALTGGLSRTAPFHWSGNRADMGAIMNDTFVTRMGGQPQDVPVVADLTAFLDRLPARASSSNVALERLELGKQSFAEAGCDSCHGGALLTNNSTLDVGTGGAFQVPSLIGLGARAPYMHDGCATTMRERFTRPACGGTKHGDVSKLDSDEYEALLDYLTSL